MAAKQAAAAAEKKKPIAVISPQKKEKSARTPRNEKAAKEMQAASEQARSRFYTMAIALIGMYIFTFSTPRSIFYTKFNFQNL